MNGADYEIFYQKTVCLYIYRINGRHNFIVLVIIYSEIYFITNRPWLWMLTNR